MKRIDAEKIKPLVNNKAALDALEHYLMLRVESLKEALLLASPEQVVRHQAAYEELKRFKYLRDEVNVAED